MAYVRARIFVCQKMDCPQNSTYYTCITCIWLIFEFGLKTYACTLFILLIFSFSLGVNFFSQKIIVFLFLIRFSCSWGLRWVFLGCPTQWRRLEGSRPILWNFRAQKVSFLAIFSMCLHFSTVPSVLLSLRDIILCLEKCSKCWGILLKIIFS